MAEWSIALVLKTSVCHAPWVRIPLYLVGWYNSKVEYWIVISVAAGSSPTTSPVLRYRQVVRHRFLIPTFKGSNPFISKFKKKYLFCT